MDRYVDIFAKIPAATVRRPLEFHQWHTRLPQSDQSHCPRYRRYKRLYGGRLIYVHPKYENAAIDETSSVPVKMLLAKEYGGVQCRALKPLIDCLFEPSPSTAMF